MSKTSKNVNTSKAVDTKAVDTKAVDTKAVDTKAVDTKAVDTKAVEKIQDISEVVKALLMFRKSNKDSDKDSDKDTFNKKMSELSKFFVNGKISYIDFAKQQKSLEVQYLNKVSNNDKLLSITDTKLDSFADSFKVDRNKLNVITKKCQAVFTQQACVVALESTLEYHKDSYKKAVKELMETLQDLAPIFETEDINLHLIHLMHQSVKTTTSTKGLVKQASQALYNYYNTIIEDNEIKYYKE